MLSADYLSSIESEGSSLLEFARREPGRAVPQYPGWTLSDLAAHTASIHARTSQICAVLPTERIPAPTLPPKVDPLEWFQANLEAMLQSLRRADPSATVWTFGSDKTIGFWERRMVIETGIHRWDAQQAFEPPSPLPDIVALAGLDEFPEMWGPRLGELPTIRLEATDLDRSWTYGSGEPIAMISGPASDIYLRLMSRPGSSLPEVWESAVDGLATPADQ